MYKLDTRIKETRKECPPQARPGAIIGKPDIHLSEKEQAGLSLIEVMIGVIILALAIIPSLNVIFSETKTVVATRDHSQAAFLAQQIMEKARAYSFKFLDEDDTTLTADEKKKTLEYVMKNDNAENSFNINGINYLIEDFKVTRVPTKTDATFMPIALVSYKIKYQGKDKRPHEIAIDTAISKQE